MGIIDHSNRIETPAEMRRRKMRELDAQMDQLRNENQQQTAKLRQIKQLTQELQYQDLSAADGTMLADHRYQSSRDSSMSPAKSFEIIKEINTKLQDIRMNNQFS